MAVQLMLRKLILILAAETLLGAATYLVSDENTDAATRGRTQLSLLPRHPAPVPVHSPLYVDACALLFDEALA
jgi:hypothetical protein